MNVVDMLEAVALDQARRSFWAFRQYINQGATRSLKLGWWPRAVSHELQKFKEELLAGAAPMLLIQAPPQHGKSVLVIEFIAWLVGHAPHLRTIYTSYSLRLGVRANLRLQRIFDSEKYHKLFPGTRIASSTGGKEFGHATRSRELLEFVGEDGLFRNTTIGGSITGESLDLGIVDDPLKGREQANSETIRNKAWDWLTDDFLTRFSEEGALLGIATSWHIDDPMQKLKTNLPNVRVLSYPALAESGFALAENDPRAPGSGEALFPELKSAEFLLRRKTAMVASNWLSLYQQTPIVIGGQIIKASQWFKRYKVAPKILWRKIYADTAMKTAEHNDYSVFECWGMGEDGNAYLLDLVRGKWEAPELRQAARDFWQKHMKVEGMGALRAMIVEDKASGTGLIQDLKRADKIPVVGMERNKDKLLRVNDVVDYIKAGYVFVPEEADWVSDFIKECEAFTADDSHANDDQIDPMCDAIKEMLATKELGFMDVDWSRRAKAPAQ